MTPEMRTYTVAASGCVVSQPIFVFSRSTAFGHQNRKTPGQAGPVAGRDVANEARREINPAANTVRQIEQSQARESAKMQLALRTYNHER